MKKLFLLFVNVICSEFKNMNLCCSQSLSNTCSSHYKCKAHMNSNIDNIVKSFTKFIKFNDKKYNSIEEYAYRLTIYSHNILKHSNKKLFINPFADWTKDEFQKYQKLYNKNIHKRTHKINNGPLPDSIDWRKHNIVAKIKDQGLCGACWSFSTICSIESATAILNKKPVVPLSEQNLIDCVKNDTTINDKCCLGCKGGMMDNAFDYIIKNQNGFVDTEDSYPYLGHDGNCKFSKKSSGPRIIDWVDIPSGDEYSLEDAVANVGPVSVTVDASDEWQFYSNGILIPQRFFGCSSRKANANHGVVIVGYGSENGFNYWIIRNSWGTNWGESGYLKLIRGRNACGIANSASYPIVEDK